MPFPYDVEGRSIASFGELGELVASDLQAGGGTVRPGAPTREWVRDLCDRLTPRERWRFVEALLGYAHPLTITLGAQLVDDRGDSLLAAILPHALVRHDAALLQRPTPDGIPLEGLLAAVAARHADLRGPLARKVVLNALRNSALSREEALVLVRYGSPAEVLHWGDDLLAEGDPEVEAILRRGVSRRAIIPALMRLFPDLDLEDDQA